jgi:hypothetical protein
MESAIQKLAIVSFFVIGLSHIFQARVWAQFFIHLHSKGEIGSFISGFINLNMGAMVVAFHNVWHGIPMILTIMGYVWVLKSLIYFVSPKHGLKAMSRVTLERSSEFIAAGVVLVGVGGLLLFSLLSRA